MEEVYDHKLDRGHTPARLGSLFVASPQARAATNSLQQSTFCSSFSHCAAT